MLLYNNKYIIIKFRKFKKECYFIIVTMILYNIHKNMNKTKYVSNT